MVIDKQKWLDGWLRQWRPDAKISVTADGATVTDTHPCKDGDITYFFARYDGAPIPENTLPIFPSMDTGHLRLINQIPTPRKINTVTAWGAACPLCMDGIDPCHIHVIQLSTYNRKQA